MLKKKKNYISLKKKTFFLYYKEKNIKLQIKVRFHVYCRIKQHDPPKFFSQRLNSLSFILANLLVWYFILALTKPFIIFEKTKNRLIKIVYGMKYSGL